METGVQAVPIIKRDRSYMSEWLQLQLRSSLCAFRLRESNEFYSALD